MVSTLKISSDCKALSPIFATLIILAIVTVLFIPVFIWSTGLTAETKSFWNISGEIATERIVIEEVNLRGGIPKCTIYVRNIGKTAIIVNDVFISSPDGSLHTYGKADLTADPDSVVQGDLTTITISDLGSFVPLGNVTYTVRVFTSRGVGDTYQKVA
jgi:FlaG/FlaF family flagellin (archaellin)